MVAYNDVPQVNLLYQEQARIDQAITMLDTGGTVNSFNVAPPPPDPEVMMGQQPMAAVMIETAAPSPALLAEARAALVARHNAITDELIALGVTASPPTR